MLSVQIHSFSYTENEILKNILFTLGHGKHLAVLGESGCGKSTLLHIIYGLLHLERGEVYWENKRLLGPKHRLIPGEPFIKLVAQELNVMPYISVTENIATHLTRFHKKADDKRVKELLDIVGLTAFKDTKVKNLSGGQKQRVALAKALANEPKLLLLDEPFSSIDIFRKNKLRRHLFEYLKQKNISCITATHDSEEALSFSDQIILLKEGSVEASGTPYEIYNAITSKYQGQFFGEITSIKVEGKIKLFLPHQLEASSNATKLLITVVSYYFKGTHYLIKGKYLGDDVYFNHRSPVDFGEQLYIKIKND